MRSPVSSWPDTDKGGGLHKGRCYIKIFSSYMTSAWMSTVPMITQAGIQGEKTNMSFPFLGVD